MNAGLDELSRVSIWFSEYVGLRGESEVFENQRGELVLKLEIPLGQSTVLLSQEDPIESMVSNLLYGLKRSTLVRDETYTLQQQLQRAKAERDEYRDLALGVKRAREAAIEVPSQ